MEKYYTPEIEDLFVGYECELSTMSGWRTGTYPEIFKLNKELDEYGDDESVYSILMKTTHARMRTPFLSKEDVEKEGWRQIHWREYIKEFEGRTIHFSNGQKESEDDEEYLSVFGVHNKSKILFEGKCPSINEFRKICKLLGI
jgi:hypothetical protein